MKIQPQHSRRFPMLQTTGKESTIFDSDRIAFGWKKKSFKAEEGLPLSALLENVSFVAINVPEEDTEEVDNLISRIVGRDEEIVRLTTESEKDKNRLDEILTAKVRATRKSNKLMDYFREKWNVALIPIKIVLFGKNYKVTKSKGSEKMVPDMGKILDTIKDKYPDIAKEIDNLSKQKDMQKKSKTSSKWSNFSKI